jgi:hypothetical protein
MFCRGHLTVDDCLLSLGFGFHAFRSRVFAFQSLALPVCGGTLAFVREQLSFVGQLLATIRETLPLIGHAISSASKVFASSDLGLTPHHRLLTLFERGNPDFQRTVVCDHSSP